MYPQQYPQQKNRRKKVLVVALIFLVATIVIVSAVSFFNKGDGNPKIVNKLTNTSLGSGASADLPISFVTSNDNGGALLSLEEPGTQTSKEKLVIEKYNQKVTTMKDLERIVTTSSKGKIPNLQAKSAKTKGGNNYLLVTKSDNGETKTTNTYYVFFGNKIWMISFNYSSGSFLDKSREQIVNSFNPGGY